jgi:hypothetical protein
VSLRYELCSYKPRPQAQLVPVLLLWPPVRRVVIDSDVTGGSTLVLSEFVSTLGQNEKEWLIRELGMDESLSQSNSVSRSESPTSRSEPYIDPERHVHYISGRKVQCVTKPSELFKK